MIDVQNLNVTFGRGKNELHAVRDVSFHIAQGESFGLVGFGAWGLGALPLELENYNLELGMCNLNLETWSSTLPSPPPLWGGVGWWLGWE